LLVDETNRCLVRPAVATATGGQRGGGTVAHPAGIELVRRYRALERRTELAVSRNLKPLLRTVSGA
jgi:molybdate transport system regulatory protein